MYRKVLPNWHQYLSGVQSIATIIINIVKLLDNSPATSSDKHIVIFQLCSIAQGDSLFVGI